VLADCGIQRWLSNPNAANKCSVAPVAASPRVLLILTNESRMAMNCDWRAAILTIPFHIGIDLPRVYVHFLILYYFARRTRILHQRLLGSLIVLSWERGSTVSGFHRRNVATARNRGLKPHRAQLPKSNGGHHAIAQSGIKCGQCVKRPHRAQRKHECWDVNDRLCVQRRFMYICGWSRGSDAEFRACC